MNIHSEATQQRFVERRAQGWTLDRIACDLGVTTRTLITWQKKFQDQIDALRRAEQEDLQSRILPSQEKELARLATRLDQVEAILARRKLECLSTEFLFCLAGSLRAQIRKQCQKPRPPSVPPNPPPDSVAIETPSTESPEHRTTETLEH